jgi:serine protease Do
MKSQDIITSVNGHAINKSQDLIDTVADTPVGTSVKVNIIRDKRPETLTVVIGDRAKIFADNVGPVKSKVAPDGDDALDVKFGMSVQGLRPADRDQIGYKGKGSVMIASVEPGSFADDIGLAKGDVILELNRQPVDKPEDLRKLQSSLKSGDSVAFHVARQAGRGGDWQSLFVPGRMP